MILTYRGFDISVFINPIYNIRFKLGTIKKTVVIFGSFILTWHLRGFLCFTPLKFVRKLFLQRFTFCSDIQADELNVHIYCENAENRMYCLSHKNRVMTHIVRYLYDDFMTTRIVLLFLSLASRAKMLITTLPALSTYPWCCYSSGMYRLTTDRE